MRDFIKNNKILATFILYIIMFAGLMIVKPSYAFNKDGSIKDFGLGYTNRTVLPIWVLVIVFAVISYFLISVF
tara:strand:- start:277 stop:495 length:219 start_codon:yes stop_codon:yes gene_type:complete